MENLIVIIVGAVVGAGLLAYNSNRKAAQEALRLAEEEARRRKIDQENARRKVLEKREAQRRETERHAALIASIQSAIKVAVSAAIEATIIGAGVTETKSNVVHVVASAFEAAGVAESTEASFKTRTGEIDNARQTAIIDSISRSSNSATTAARKAASLDPLERTDIVRDTRIHAIEAAIASAVKDEVAHLRGNEDFNTIKNVRGNARNLDVFNQIGSLAHEIEKDRAKIISQAREREAERIDAIISSIEPPNAAYASIASSIAASGRAFAIKETRLLTRDHTVKMIVARAIEAVTQDSSYRSEAAERTTIATIVATLTTYIIDRIEDAIEDAVALTSMRTGRLGEDVDPSIAHAIEITTHDVIHRIIEDAKAGTNEKDYPNENIFGLDEAEELTSYLNVPTDNFEMLPKLEHPAGYVYVIQDVTHTLQYKIGRTNHPKTRISNFGVELPFETDIIAILKSTNMVDLERSLHDQYALYRTQGEWFKLGIEQIEEIRSM